MNLIKAIVCVDKNWGIGKNNEVLYTIKEDLDFFKEETMGKIVVCGANTLKSFPNSKPLKKRSTIVLCSEGTEFEDCICVHSFEEALKMVKCLSLTNDIYIIGGGKVYEQFLPYCDMVYVTKVDKVDPEATVFFKNLDEDDDFIQAPMGEGYSDRYYTKYKFVSYIRKV